MNKLTAGFARMDITPMTGISLAGYYQARHAKGVLDALEVNALALGCGEAQAVLLSVDHCGICRAEAEDLRTHVAEETGLPREAIYLHATHTHTAPELHLVTDDPLEQEYYRLIYRRLADAARFALADRKPARMGWSTGVAPHIAFVRRYRMKDGSIRTNPGVDNPDIVEPVGQVDERVHVLRFDREGGETLVLVNFGNHPDVVGGEKISADWPGFLRRTVERTLPHTRCIFCNGAQGDVNHVNVHPRGGDGNDMFQDFDDVARGYGHARYMGRVVTGAVLQAYDKAAYVDVDRLVCLERGIRIPANVPTPEEAAAARRINDLHQAGRDAELPYAGMMLTTVVAEAERMVKLEHGPDCFDMTLHGIALGPVALIGIPGEPFTGIGLGLKAAPGWDLVLPTCLTDGNEGYFPMRDAYDEGGYESRSSPFQAGVAERLIEAGRTLLEALRP